MWFGSAGACEPRDERRWGEVLPLEGVSAADHTKARATIHTDPRDEVDETEVTRPR